MNNQTEKCEAQALRQKHTRKLPRVTIQQIVDMDPCWFQEDRPAGMARIKQLFRGRKSLNVVDIMNLRSVSAVDKMWVVFRDEFWPNPERDLRLLACGFAETALHNERRAGREPDERSWEAVRVAKLYAAGEANISELAAAWDAAWDAARAAAGAAARAAAWDAAWDAARAAARDAARAAAWDAAGAAARDAARAAQVRSIRKYAQSLIAEAERLSI